jgi:hypothetical protein
VCQPSINCGLVCSTCDPGGLPPVCLSVCPVCKCLCITLPANRLIGSDSVGVRSSGEAHHNSVTASGSGSGPKNVMTTRPGCLEQC